MFRKEMSEKLKEIFGVKKVTFDEPGESFEQDTIFVQIQKSRCNTGQGKQTAKVEGALVLFCQRDKAPYGFFNKRIEQADAALKRDFLFFDMDVEALNSPARLQNISERRVSFVFLYSAQYDPNQGELTSVEFGG